MEQDDLMLLLGELKKGQDNTLTYIKSVSRNQVETRKDLAEHKLSNDAHGADVARISSTRLIAWGGLACGLAAFVLNGYAVLWGN